MAARSFSAVSCRPRASTTRSTAKTSGAVISAIGRAPDGRAGESQQPFDLADGSSGLTFAPLLVQNSAAMASNVLAERTLSRPWRVSWRGRGLVPRPRAAWPLPARLGPPKANRGIDADRQHLLKAVEPIGEAPALRAIRQNPQLQPAAIRELDNFFAGLGRCGFPYRSGACWYLKCWYRRHTNKDTNNFCGYQRTPPDALGRQSGPSPLFFSYFSMFWDAGEQRCGAARGISNPRPHHYECHGIPLLIISCSFL